jgi:hypothetical protein
MVALVKHTQAQVTNTHRYQHTHLTSKGILNITLNSTIRHSLTRHTRRGNLICLLRSEDMS